MRERYAIIAVALLFGGAIGAVGVFTVARYSRGDGPVIESHPLRYWVKCLESDDQALREHAVTVLPKFGDDGVAATIPMLASAVAQDGAVEALRKIGPPAVHPLIRSLSARSPQARIGAIRALDALGPAAAAPATSAVAKLLGDDLTGSPAAQFLAHVGPNADAVASALDVLEHGNTARQVDAIRVLGQAGSDPAVVPVLRKMLAVRDISVRVAAFDALCNLTPPPVEAAPVMIDGLTHSETRASARVGLARLSTAAIPSLRACTTRPATEIRLEAVGILAQHVPSDASATQAVLEFVPDPDPIVAATAVASLASVRERDLPFVKQQLAAEQPKVRAWAVREIRKIQPPLIDDLAPLLDDREEMVRNEAADAIRGNWQADDPAILHAPLAKDVQERIRGIRLLPFFRDLKKYDMMLAAMEDSQEQVRLAATKALGRSITSGRAVQRLVEAMKSDPSPEIRATAAASLAAARSTMNVEAALRQATHDPDPSVAAAAEYSLRPRNIER